MTEKCESGCGREAVTEYDTPWGPFMLCRPCTPTDKKVFRPVAKRLDNPKQRRYSESMQ